MQVSSGRLGQASAHAVGAAAMAMTAPAPLKSLLEVFGADPPDCGGYR